jgi:hypothetical protein
VRKKKSVQRSRAPRLESLPKLTAQVKRAAKFCAKHNIKLDGFLSMAVDTAVDSSETDGGVLESYREQDPKKSVIVQIMLDEPYPPLAEGNYPHLTAALVELAGLCNQYSLSLDKVAADAVMEIVGHWCKDDIVYHAERNSRYPAPDRVRGAAKGGAA